MYMELNIIGATGLVGKEIIKLLEKIELKKIENINFIASKNSKGVNIKFKNIDYQIEMLENIDFNKQNITINCSSSEIAKDIFQKNYDNTNMYFIDNSSALRMLKTVPLVVPHINFPENYNNFFANPNCSTIILSCLLKPLIDYKIERIIISSYQAASGAGKEGLDELYLQMNQLINNKVLTTDFWKRQYIGNCFVHNSELTESFYNTEEVKLINETKKILKNYDIGITATCIRVPTIRSHCMSVNIQFKIPIDYKQIIKLLKEDPNIVLMDDKKTNNFPDTIVSSNDTRVYVGHIRSDSSLKQNIGWNFWISGDQLLRGAAYNAVMILNKLL